MIKTLIGGIAVGIANIIPGVSGGTMLVVLGLFNKLMNAITNVIKKDNPNRLKDLLFIVQIGIGVVIGIIVFANILEWLFTKYPTQTLYWFIGLVLFSLPSFVKNEMEGIRFKVIPFIIGGAFIFGLFSLSSEQVDMVPTVYPTITLFYLLKLTLIGAIVGSAMLIPGGNGSIWLMIIGEYYYFQSYLAKVLYFQMDILIRLGFIGIGSIVGIVIAAKIMKHLLDHYKVGTLNFILGLTIASALVLVPIKGVEYNMYISVTSVLSFIFGGIVVYLLEKIVR